MGDRVPPSPATGASVTSPPAAAGAGGKGAPPVYQPSTSGFIPVDKSFFDQFMAMKLSVSDLVEETKAYKARAADLERGIMAMEQQNEAMKQQNVELAAKCAQLLAASSSAAAPPPEAPLRDFLAQTSSHFVPYGDSTTEDPDGSTASTKPEVAKSRLRLTVKVLELVGDVLPVKSVMEFKRAVQLYAEQHLDPRADTRVGQLPFGLANSIGAQVQDLLRSLCRSSTQPGSTPSYPATSLEWMRILDLYTDIQGPTLAAAIATVPAYKSASGAKGIPSLEMALCNVEQVFDAMRMAVQSTNKADREDPSTRTRVTEAVLKRIPEPVRNNVCDKLAIARDGGVVPRTVTLEDLSEAAKAAVRRIWVESLDTHKEDFRCNIDLSGSSAVKPAVTKAARAGDRGDLCTFCTNAKGRAVRGHDVSVCRCKKAADAKGAAKPESGKAAGGTPAAKAPASTAAGAGAAGAGARGDGTSKQTNGCSNCRDSSAAKHAVSACKLPCRFFEAGSCRMGSSCPLKHASKSA